MTRRHDPEAGDPVRPGRTGPGPRSLADLLGAAARDRPGWDRRLDGARVHGLWAEIAGAQLARHTEPVRLSGGVLVVRAATPAWATQLRYLSAELIERANAVLGEGMVGRVTVVTGPPQGNHGDAEKGL